AGGGGDLSLVPREKRFEKRRFHEGQKTSIEIVALRVAIELARGPALQKFIELSQVVAAAGLRLERLLRRQMLGADRFAPREDQSMFDCVSQLAHVPGPGAAFDLGECFGRERLRRAVGAKDAGK